MCYKFYVNFLSKLRNKQTFQLICLQKNLSQEIIPVRNKYFKEKNPLHCHSVSVERSLLYYVSDFWIIRETDNVSFGVNNDFVQRKLMRESTTKANVMQRRILKARWNLTFILRIPSVYSQTIRNSDLFFNAF